VGSETIQLGILVGLPVQHRNDRQLTSMPFDLYQSRLF